MRYSHWPFTPLLTTKAKEPVKDWERVSGILKRVWGSSHTHTHTHKMSSKCTHTRANFVFYCHLGQAEIGGTKGLMYRTPLSSTFQQTNMAEIESSTKEGVCCGLTDDVDFSSNNREASCIHIRHIWIVVTKKRRKDKRRKNGSKSPFHPAGSWQLCRKEMCLGNNGRHNMIICLACQYSFKQSFKNTALGVIVFHL